MNLSIFAAGFARVLVPLCSCATALAGVTYVDASGNGQFTSIQAAVDVALDGDVLLVRTGNYAGFTVDNRDLWIVADAGALPKVTNTVTVRNMASNKTVLLSGLEIRGASGFSAQMGLRIENNASHVRVQGCTVRGGDGSYQIVGTPGGQGTSILNSLKVAFVGCSLTGGNGGGIAFYVDTGGRGGDGVVTQGSVVALYDCVIKGGMGGAADYIYSNQRAGDGGHGCHVINYGILASGCQFNGGMGGGEASIPGNGGHGLLVDAGQAQLIGDTFAGGSGGYGYYGNSGTSGLPQAGAGVFNVIAGAARKISAPALAAENGSIRFDLAGEQGDRFWLLQTSFPDFIYSPANAGVRLILAMAFSSSRPHAILPTAGTATVFLNVPDIAVATPALRKYWQCVVVTASGQIRLGSAQHITVLNCSALQPDCDGNGSCDSCDLLLPGAIDCDKNGVPDSCQPDCNANGVADACDIASGSSVDQNHNGIPDDCEPQRTWYVNVNAAPGGNGSAGAPFQALGPAFAQAISGDTVLVSNGIYQGSANRGLDFGGRNLIVQGLGGAANCIIDCQSAGRAFFAGAGVTSAARVQGLTIRNGKVRGFSGLGGGMYLQHSSPQILQCVFDHCEASSGGGMFLDDSNSLILGCSFVGNKSPTGAGGGVRIEYDGGARIVDCNFVGNQASQGGGISTHQTHFFMERCLFQSNTASSLGGAIHGYYGEIFLDQCWIAGNTAPLGGAFAGVGGNPWHVTGTTVVDNVGTQRAGAAYFSNDSTLAREWRNCIFWNNTSTSGTAIEVLRGPLNIAWCDIQGAQASVTLGANATLTWGAGNINANPSFVDPDGPDNNPLTIGDNDDRLALGSPCLDAGENASVPQDWFDLDGDGNATEAVPFDFDGQARFVDIPSAPDTGSGAPPLVDMGAWERP